MRIRSVSLLIVVAAVVICTSAAMAFTPVNIAPDATVTASTHYGNYFVSNLVDGDLSYDVGGAYSSTAGGNFFMLVWDQDVTFDQVNILNPLSGNPNPALTPYGLGKFTISIDTPTGWQIVDSADYTATGLATNPPPIYTFTAATALTTSAIRVDIQEQNVVAGDTGIRLCEVEVMSAEVPEPMTMSLLALGGLGVLRRRRG